MKNRESLHNHCKQNINANNLIFFIILDSDFSFSLYQYNERCIIEKHKNYIVYYTSIMWMIADCNWSIDSSHFATSMCIWQRNKFNKLLLNKILFEVQILRRIDFVRYINLSNAKIINVYLAPKIKQYNHNDYTESYVLVKKIGEKKSYR